MVNSQKLIDALENRKVLCWVGWDLDEQGEIMNPEIFLISKFESDALERGFWSDRVRYPFPYAKPLTLEETKNIIFE